MKKTLVFAVSALFALTLIHYYLPAIYAHPGNTASDGCHYCRTNCDKWGVPWNERHCHGGVSVSDSASAAQSQSTGQGYSEPVALPTSTPRPIVYPTATAYPTSTPRPLATLTPMPTYTPTPTLEPTVTPVREVQGENDVITPEPTVAVEGEATKGDATAGTIALLGILGGGFWLTRKIVKKFKSSPKTPSA